jgi:hypothetical protein
MGPTGLIAFLALADGYSPPGKEKKGTKPDRFDAIARNFYWLNVVRFFCGCFSKGDIWIWRIGQKELIADPMLGQSRHSVTLAATLPPGPLVPPHLHPTPDAAT